jgi:hypothetical protein
MKQMAKPRWRDLDLADAGLVFDDRPTAGSSDGVRPDYTPRFC